MKRSVVMTMLVVMLLAGFLCTEDAWGGCPRRSVGSERHPVDGYRPAEFQQLPVPDDALGPFSSFPSP
jgi:hypothetical protein